MKPIYNASDKKSSPDEGLRRLRSLTWLLAVQSRCGGRNNCQLDVHFGPLDGLGKKLEPATRLKMFEAIQSNGSIPIEGATERRDFNLVAKVDAEPGYEGTAAILRSPIWKLLSRKPIPLEKVRELVVECIKNLGLATLPGQYSDDGENELEDLISSNPETTIEEYFQRQKTGDYGYDMAMGEAFGKSEISLDLICLSGALSFEAIYAGNMSIASYQVDIFKNLLETFCNSSWMQKKDLKDNLIVGDKLYQYALSRMLDALYADALNGLPDYSLMLSEINGVNSGSPIVALLKRHQRLLWRK